MSDRERFRAPPQPEPPPHRVRAADLYPRLRTHYDEPGLDVPFTPICGEFVQVRDMKDFNCLQRELPRGAFAGLVECEEQSIRPTTQSPDRPWLRTHCEELATGRAHHAEGLCR